MPTVKRLLALTAAAGTAAALAIPAFAATKTDRVTDSGFKPATISIGKGGTIVAGASNKS